MGKEKSNEVKFDKEQLIVAMVYAWNEGYKWNGSQKQEEPLCIGSLQYLVSKIGNRLQSLDLHNQIKAKQLMEAKRI